MSSPLRKPASNKPSSVTELEKDWVSTPSPPVSATYGTPQPSSSPTHLRPWLGPGASSQNHFTYPSLSQLESPPRSYPSNGLAAGASHSTPLGPSMVTAPTVTTYITDYAPGHSHSIYYGATKPSPPSYGIAITYKHGHAGTRDGQNSGAQRAPSGCSPAPEAASRSSSQPHLPTSQISPAQQQLYPGQLFIPSTPPALPTNQQYLHKGANSNNYNLVYNPYVTSNPYQQGHRSGSLPAGSYSAHPAPNSPSPSIISSPYAVPVPEFGKDPKVQIGASHLAASSAQADYMRQIIMLQSLYGYQTSSLDSEYATPSSVYRGSPVSPKPDHSATKQRATLTHSVDTLLASGAKDTFIEEQERILRECNAKRGEHDKQKEPILVPLPLPVAPGVLVDDDEALFEELLRSENPNASVSYPVLVVPEMVEALDEKLEKRILEARAFSNRARNFPYLDNTLWNLAYTLPRPGTLEANAAGSTSKSRTRHGYLVSSKGRREPLEESVGKDWQLLDEPTAPQGGNSIFDDILSVMPFTNAGRFQKPSNMVTLDNPLAYSARPSQIEKATEIEKEVYKDDVNLQQLQSFCLGYGIPKRVRAFVWQLMLGYLPTKSAERLKVLRTKRMEYFNYFNQFLSEKAVLSKPDRTMFNLVLVDAPRTHPDGYHSLFSKPAIQASLERVLYLWARNHPETSYYQGLNDLASVVMVVFLECCLPDLADVGSDDSSDSPCESSFLASPQGNDALEKALFCVEADTYHCLSAILNRVRDFHHFSAGGVYSESMVVHFEELVRRADPQLHKHFIDSDMLFIQFAFRWMLCFFTREVETRNLVCLWDSYIVEPLSFPIFHIYICAAYLIELRKQLLGSDMIAIMGFLQRAPTGHFTKHDIHRLAQHAAELSVKFPLNIKQIKRE